MQRQKGVIGSLPESLTLEHGSTSSDSGAIEQQFSWTNFIQNPPANANQETRNLSMWGMGESSSSTVPNQASQNRVDPKIGRGWLSFIKAQPEHHQHEPSASRLSLGGHNASSSSGPVETEAQQLPRKRKADELNIGQSSTVESSNILQRTQGSTSVWQPVLENPTLANTMLFDPTIPILGSSIGSVSSYNSAMENIHRNVRARVNNSHQQDQLHTSNIRSNGVLNFSDPYASLGLNHVATTGDGSSSRQSQPLLQVPGLSRSLHSSSRSRRSSSRANQPVTSNNVGSGSYLRTTPPNISYVRNTAQTAVNLGLDSAGGHISLSSTSNPTPNVGPRRGSSLYPSRRQTEIIRRALLSSIDSRAGGDGGGQTSNLFSRVPAPIAGQHPHLHLARLRTADRQLDGVFGYPYISRTAIGGSERRGRLASEMRNVLDLIRRREVLRFEDFMILDPSVFYGMADIHDRHRDMRLDIDNMSYEELLALEERIGNVNTGLTEETICKRLKQKTYVSVADQPDDEPCCVCQEEYKNGDDLGALECGHEFHTSCIKQWLLQKNACPVCKSAASK
ncbi:hypothetical protein QVD17_25179 [Tagetes erecta]|uniref:RING-type E3 ubiquitin transferase n=1 Tax=Tagetes erecta TaxID=13708 RepID=A0AAD8KJE1_TARER|nr:hypothetical protein QVD17_25179 [Tagetes erecta]